jgi:hypothetical protein
MCGCIEIYIYINIYIYLYIYIYVTVETVSFPKMQSSCFKATGEKTLVGFFIKELLLPQVDGAYKFSFLKLKLAGV